MILLRTGEAPKTQKAVQKPLVQRTAHNNSPGHIYTCAPKLPSHAPHHPKHIASAWQPVWQQHLNLQMNLKLIQGHHGNCRYHSRCPLLAGSAGTLPQDNGWFATKSHLEMIVEFLFQTFSNMNHLKLEGKKLHERVNTCVHLTLHFGRRIRINFQAIRGGAGIHKSIAGKVSLVLLGEKEL